MSASGLLRGEARTAGFTVLVLAQLFNAFSARSERESAVRHLFANRWLWAAVTLSALLQVAVVEFAPLNDAFGTSPLSSEQWIVCAAMASSVLWFAELRKLTGRLWRGRGHVDQMAAGLSKPYLGT